MTSERVTRCPWCGRANHLHSGPTPGAMPKPGDVSLCWSCGGCGFYAEDFSVRLPTEQEAVELAASPKIREVQDSIRGARGPDQANERRWRR